MGFASSFTLKMKDSEQAQAVLPIVQACIKNVAYWRESLEINDNIIYIEDDTPMFMSDYPYLVLGICTKIAQAYPDYTFKVSAYGYEDNDLYSCDEEGTLANGEFRFSSSTSQSAAANVDLDEIDPEELDELLDDFTETNIITTGKLVDGKMTFTTQK